LRQLVTATLAGEGKRAREIGVVLTGDAELRELNRRHRGIDRATDVLSFGYDDNRAGVSGDLVISLDRMREQARRYRVGRGRELARLVVHGTLHLAGHDHHRAFDRRLMRIAEQRALRAAGRTVARLDRALDALD
jgi:probable rRNA maturation factor